MTGAPTTIDLTHRTPVRLDDGEATVSVARADLDAALAEVAVGGGSLRVEVRAGLLEITGQRADGTWETAAIELAPAGSPHAVAYADAAELRAAVRRRSRAELRLRVGTRLALEGTEVADARNRLGPVPRPEQGGERTVLPASAPIGATLRLSTVTLRLPTTLRARFAERRVSSVIAYAHDGSWYLSGVANQEPMIVVVAPVASY